VRILLVLLALAVPASAQETSSQSAAPANDLTYRGFAEVQIAAYPQDTPQDDDRFAGDARFRIEPAYRAASWLTLAGSFDGRIDNLRQVERKWRVDVRDRGVGRPALSVRHAQAVLRKNRLSLTLGKQFIRWGKTDILNPTDRFAPRDFVEVTDDEFLAVTAARTFYEHGAHSLDVVVVPWFTPSRIPVPGRRWSPPLPQTLVGQGVVDGGRHFPERAQYGARWNVVGSAAEVSLSYFDGFNHLPEFSTQLQSGSGVPLVALRQSYAPIRMGGADAAVPLRWFIVKGEIAGLASDGADSDDLVLYVIQVERQLGELSLVAGYAGEAIVTRRSEFDFAPDRGVTRAIVGRAAYTLGPTSDMTVESVVRQNGRGVWVKGQYSRAIDARWRVSLAGAIIGGRDDDFIGQYRRNSHLLTTLRYSF
jgi:hypothetical protein